MQQHSVGWVDEGNPTPTVKIQRWVSCLNPIYNTIQLPHSCEAGKQTHGHPRTSPDLSVNRADSGHKKLAGEIADRNTDASLVQEERVFAVEVNVGGLESRPGINDAVEQ
jgi:hypothetical protein